MIAEVLNRHEKAALMFSGGKDSLACLFLLRPYLEKITVIWVNTGDIFPENEAIVRNFAATVPSFMEVKTDVAAFKDRFGLPSDIVPIQHTEIGMFMTGKKELKLVSGYDCCSQNIWFPALAAAQNIGATLVIRGQRNQETAKSQLRSGHIQNGLELLFPIEDWTQDEVLSYLEKQGFEIPEFFHFAESSLDCINCTAFLSGISDRKDYMRKHHPSEHEANQRKLEKIAAVVKNELESLENEIRH